jgi:phosphatidylcholine synthase
MNGVGRGPATQRWAALAVHLFTASGAAVALIALEAAIERDFPRCFAWLGVALFIDGVDGTLARAARVAERASAIDGVVLDLVVDFLTYVVTPVVAIWRSDLMPPTLSFALGLVVTFASALYFADKRMKTRDYWFRGFPALWNIVAIYLFVLQPPVIVSSLMMLLGSAAMFAPIVFVHPLRVKKLRAATITASLAFFALSAVAIWQQFDAALWVKAGFVVIAIYFFALPLIRHSPWAESREEW